MLDTERETSRGTLLAQEAGTSLSSIFGVVERQASEIEAINRMAAQQLQSSGSIVQIMQTVSDSTLQSSDSTRDAAQNMERVARLAEQLLASVEAFKLRENVPVRNSGEVSYNPHTLSGAFRTVTAAATNTHSRSGQQRNGWPEQAPYPVPVSHRPTQVQVVPNGWQQGQQFPTPATASLTKPRSLRDGNGRGGDGQR